jgi:hypothetical protein
MFVLINLINFVSLILGLRNKFVNVKGDISCVHFYVVKLVI